MRAVGLAVLLACAPSTGKPTSDVDSPPVAPNETPKGEAPSSTEPIDPSFSVVQKICASSCAGPMARLAMFRRENGELGVVRFDGDLQTCSHPPRLYFDAKGEQILAIPLKPVEPGSEEAKQFAAQQEAATAGMKEAELFYCPDAARCEPSRTEGFRSAFPCRTDNDCLDCQCQPVNRAEWTRRGGAEACQDPNAECIATNAACCDGKCSMAR